MEEVVTKYKIISSVLLFAFLVILGACSKEDDLIILNPDAGSDFLNIENDGYVVKLNAVPAPEGQLGTWHIYIGKNGRFDNANDPKTQFYGEPGEKYVLGWELSEGGEYKSESIDVSFKALKPVIFTSVQDTIYNNISLYLKAEAPRFGAKGTWTIVDGNGGQILKADQNEAEFIGVDFEEYTVRWSLTYGSKEVFKEIQFVTDQLKASAGEDNLDIKTSKQVNTKFFTLEGFLPAGASGTWNIIAGENGMVHSKNIGNSLFEGEADSTYTLTWTVNLENIESVDTVNIRFRGNWGMWTDSRDGQSYRFTEVNHLEWMADNYNYAAEPGTGSWYYGQAERSIIKTGHPLETEADRKKYGRVYNYSTAIDYAPEGWRLPTTKEFIEMLSSLGGPLFANDKIIEGGDANIELNFPGYFEQSSGGDPAFRNVFTSQDQTGMYWLNDYSEYSGYAAFFVVGANYEQPGHDLIPTFFYSLSVRYVRNVETNK